jgi:hypothetical protein
MSVTHTSRIDCANDEARGTRPAMMDTTEIVRVLGSSRVEAVEKAITEAFAAAEKQHDAAEGTAAVNALLVLMLASAIITPTNGVEARAHLVSDLIVDLVEDALSLSPAPSTADDS